MYNDWWDYNRANELYHHGIEGQKWGVQNGPPYPIPTGDHSAAEKKKMARSYSKDLNDRDKKLAFDKRDYYENAYNSLKTSKKIDKLKNKKETEARIKKIAKLETKRKEYDTNAKEYAKKIKDSNEYAKKYVDNLNKNGYTVKEIATSRNTTRGSEYAAMVAGMTLQTLASMAGVPTFVVYRYSSTPGTKYKVTANKEKI